MCLLLTEAAAWHSHITLASGCQGALKKGHIQHVAMVMGRILRTTNITNGGDNELSRIRLQGGWCLGQQQSKSSLQGQGKLMIIMAKTYHSINVFLQGQGEWMMIVAKTHHLIFVYFHKSALKCLHCVILTVTSLEPSSFLLENVNRCTSFTI